MELTIGMLLKGVHTLGRLELSVSVGKSRLKSPTPRFSQVYTNTLGQVCAG